MGNKKRIKALPVSSSSKAGIRPKEGESYDDYCILFSLERVQQGNFCFSKLNKDNKVQFSEAMFKRKNLTWKSIKNEGRHGLGFEKISKMAIKAPIPKFITADVKHFLAFRYHGKQPIVGYRQKNIFYVLWFDSNFKLYNH